MRVKIQITTITTRMAKQEVEQTKRIMHASVEVTLRNHAEGLLEGKTVPCETSSSLGNHQRFILGFRAQAVGSLPNPMGTKEPWSAVGVLASLQ